MSKLIGYVRVSTDEQAKDGISLAAQKHRISSWCEAMDAEFLGVEVDEAISGSVHPDKRPGLAAALTKVRSGEADGLVIVKLDRLSRDTRVILDLVAEFNKHKWQLASLTESLDTRTPHGKFFVTVLAGMSEMEREQGAVRTKAALAEINRQHRCPGKRVPFGWRTQDGDAVLPQGTLPDGTHRDPDQRTLIPHPVEQEQIEMMLRLCAGGMGPTRIARALGTSPRTGRPWNVSTLRRVIGRAQRAAEICDLRA